MRETDGFVDVDERKREKNVHNIDVSSETSDSKRSLKEVRISEEERKGRLFGCRTVLSNMPLICLNVKSTAISRRFCGRSSRQSSKNLLSVVFDISPSFFFLFFSWDARYGQSHTLVLHL